MLSAKLRQAFFLILYHSIDKGITSQEFSQYLWPGKSYEKAKNSRGVTLNNLRKILSDLDGINLVHERGIYKITLSDECHCDYLRCLEIVKGDDLDKNMDEFVSIISRGKFLKSENNQILDAFKEYIERKIESTVYYYMEKSYSSGNFSTTISLCESIFNLDPLDEEALRYILSSLTKLDRGFIIEPICRVGSMACWQNAASIFEGNANNLGAEVGCQLQFVGYCRRFHVERGHPACNRIFALCPHGIYAIVACAIHGFTRLLYNKIVSCYTMYRRNCTCIYSCMPYGRKGGNMIQHRILAAEALVEQPLKASLRVPRYILIPNYSVADTEFKLIKYFLLFHKALSCNIPC